METLAHANVKFKTGLKEMFLDKNGIGLLWMMWRAYFTMIAQDLFSVMERKGVLKVVKRIRNWRNG